MDIINKFGIDIASILAEIVNFIALVGILYYILYKKIFFHIEERQRRVNESIEIVEKSEKILTQAENERKEIIADARVEAETIKENILNSARIEEERIISEAKKRAEEIISKSKAEAEKEKEKIMSSAQKEISQLVVLGVEKVLEETK